VDSKGQVALAPRLAQNRSYILPVNSAHSKKIVDLMLTTGETLIGASSFTTSITELQNYGRIREGHPLFVASSAEDRAVLRCLGVPVLPLQAFERLGAPEIRQLQDLLRKGALPERQRQRGLADAGDRTVHAVETVQESVASSDVLDDRKLVKPVRLVFVNWSPARLDPTDVPDVLKIASQLRTLDCELKLQLPLYNILVWKPSLNWITRVVCTRLAHGFERDILSDLADIDADCKWLSPGSSQFHAAEIGGRLRGPRAAAAAEWREGTEVAIARSGQ
jgi:hypothetical protein